MRSVYRVIFITTILFVLSAGLLCAQEQMAEIFMPDGQFINRPIRVYVSGIQESLLTNPRLCLIMPGKDPTKESGKNLYDKGMKPIVRDKNHVWQQNISGFTELINKTGALLLFDMQDFQIPFYKPGTRVLPILYYGQEQAIETVISDHEVYVSHRGGTIFAVIIIVAPLIFLISLLAHKDHYLMGLLSTQDGRMSISLTQMFLWTVAVGSVVLAIALARLQVPHIPGSLVVLMGLSVTTSVMGHRQSDSLIEEKRKRKEFKEPDTPKLSHLIMIKVPGNWPDDSDLTKAQLLFWTVITLTIFVIQSATKGCLWDVPQELVVLMGISQAGFLTRKQFLVVYERKKTREKEEEEREVEEREVKKKKTEK